MHGSRRVGEANCPSLLSRSDFNEAVTKRQNIGAKLFDHLGQNPGRQGHNL